jgi:hypothetical protein
MTENEKSPGWLLPVIVVVLLGSVLLIFVASRRVEGEVRDARARQDQEGIGYTLPETSSETDPVDPCSLISRAEVEKILGREVGAPVSEELNDAVGQKRCIFGEPDQPDQALVVVEIVFEKGMETELLQAGYNVGEIYSSRKLPEQQIQELPEIEDEAFWGGDGGEVWNGLHVRSADVYLRVSTYLGDEDAAFDAAQQLAVIILENLFQ